MSGLRKAGQFLANMDEKYADRAAKDMGGVEKNPAGVMLGGTPFNKMKMEQADNLAAEIAGRVTIGGVGALNAGYRYGLPAAGLTLAGQGLIDTMNAFGNEADKPAPNELGM